MAQITIFFSFRKLKIMATWPSKSALWLLIILSLVGFLEAQSTARASTSWTNNKQSAINITASPFDNVSGPFMRIILLKEIPNIVGSASGIAGGFLSDGANGFFFLAIGFVRTQKDSSTSQELWSDLDVVWLANRNTPVHENATLQLLSDGDLVLRDVDETLVWSTNTSNMSVASLEIMETGNLVLFDADNKTVWQSFDHPADTLLSGQKLMSGQKLVSGVSATNWSEGSFYLSVTSQGLFAFYQSDVPQMYFKFPVRRTKQSTEVSYVRCVNGTLAIYISSAEPSKPDDVFSYPLPSSSHYIKLDLDGHLRVYGVDNGVIDLLADFLKECDYPTVCGNYGMCSNGRCSCPEGYTQDNVSDDQGNYGCSEISPATCQNPQSHSLLPLKDVYYFNYVDTDAAFLKGTDIESCKQACLKNCSCKAGFFQYFYNFSYGNCILPSPVLSLISDVQNRKAYRSYAFIKISNDPNNSIRGFSPSAFRAEIIAGSVVGVYLLIVLIIGFWIIFWRKRRVTEEDVEDYLDQVSGMPKRFSYEELTVATGNFQKKLGEGGFGSVYEGSLGNGAKIAVKRLDSLGQGKKEFLAEVKTIGSIHHVNLVRLIGFCAENFQRLLVYEFMCNGSLDKWIFYRNPAQTALDWQIRKAIILDIAKGLAYLHEECRQRIVHLDIKPQNILLDANFHAKISDFGLSKLIDRDQSQVVTTLRGTPGYLAPEWFNSIITEKADVYSFGIVVMEMVCGRKNLDRSQPEECMHLLGMFMKKAEDDQLIDLVDKHNENMQLHRSEAREIMRVSLWCLQSDYTRRPSMSTVVRILEGTMQIEVELDYSIPDPTTMVALKRKVESSVTAPLLPSILSGPR